jgi:hypothetical protein
MTKDCLPLLRRGRNDTTSNKVQILMGIENMEPKRLKNIFKNKKFLFISIYIQLLHDYVV